MKQRSPYWTYNRCGKFSVILLLSGLPTSILRSAISPAHDPVDGVSVGSHLPLLGYWKVHWPLLPTTMLLALKRSSSTADLSSLDIQWRSYQSEGVTFRPIHLVKQSRSSKQRTDFFFPAFKEDLKVCPVETLKAYEIIPKKLGSLNLLLLKQSYSFLGLGNTTQWHHALLLDGWGLLWLKLEFTPAFLKYIQWEGQLALK